MAASPFYRIGEKGGLRACGRSSGQDPKEAPRRVRSSRAWLGCRRRPLPTCPLPPARPSNWAAWAGRRLARLTGSVCTSRGTFEPGDICGRWMTGCPVARSSVRSELESQGVPKEASQKLAGVQEAVKTYGAAGQERATEYLQQAVVKVDSPSRVSQARHEEAAPPAQWCCVT